MAVVDKNQLSDQNLIVGTSELSDLSTKWNTDIVSAGLSSLNIKGAFSALTGQGVGVSYIESLMNAIEKAEQNALNISKMIGTTASEQAAADDKGANESSQNPYDSYKPGTNNRRPSGGGGGGSNNSNNNNDSNDDNNDKEKPEVDIDPGNDTEEQKLSDEEIINVVEEFISLFNGNLGAVLFDETFASKVKEQLLASPNISKETKEVLSKIDPKILQTYLQDIMLTGAGITGFSKLVVTIFEQDLKNKNIKASIYDAAENISEVYTDLADSNNLQGELKELYNGSAPLSEVDDNTIYFTRDFVDTVATANNVTSEEILTETKYNESLSLEVKDIANTFSVITEANNRDSKTKSTLYTNIIIKQEGNIYG